MRKKLKILAAGDIHGDSRLASQLAERAEKEKVDLVILCGDLTDEDKPTKGIISPFTKKNKKVFKKILNLLYPYFEPKKHKSN